MVRHRSSNRTYEDTETKHALADVTGECHQPHIFFKVPLWRRYFHVARHKRRTFLNIFRYLEPAWMS